MCRCRIKFLPNQIRGHSGPYFIYTSKGGIFNFLILRRTAFFCPRLAGRYTTDLQIYATPSPNPRQISLLRQSAVPRTWRRFLNMSYLVGHSGQLRKIIIPSQFAHRPAKYEGPSVRHFGLVYQRRKGFFGNVRDQK